MKRFLAGVLIAVILLLTFGAALYVFFPWEASVHRLWRKGVLAAAERGAVLEASSISVDGLFPLRASVEGVRLLSSLFTMESGRAKISFSPWRTILSMSPSAELRFEKASVGIPLTGESPLAFPAAGLGLSWKSGEMRIDPVAVAGDLSISGNLAVKLAAGGPSLAHADLAIRGDRVQLLDRLKAVFPLKKDEAGGAWTLKKGGRSRES